MKLTETQSQIVEDNHSLIYWIANMYKLDKEEWYDILAIELCLTVMKWEEEKGGLANYYKIRCHSLIIKEYEKKKSKKRINNGVYPLSEYVEYEAIDNTEEEVELGEVFNQTNGEILKMKYQGYTQQEIAEKLGVTQSYVSKLMQKMRKDYNVDR